MTFPIFAISIQKWTELLLIFMHFHEKIDWFPKIRTGKVDGFGIRFDRLVWIRYSSTYLFVATNKEVILIKLMTFFEVLLSEMCYCLRLYGTLNGLHLVALNYTFNVVFGVGGTPKGLHLNANLYVFVIFWFCR